MTSSTDLASQIATAYFMATLTPTPPFSQFESPEAEARFEQIGRELLGMLLSPSEVSIVRCAYSREPDKTRALVTVHDRRLALFQRRGRVGYGTRLIRTSIVDIRMARTAGLRSLLTWCPTCGDGHEVTLRSLEHADTNAISDRTFHVPVKTLLPEAIIIYEGDLPDEPGWYANVAFALAVGPLDDLWYIETERMALNRYVYEILPREEAPTK